MKDSKYIHLIVSSQENKEYFFPTPCEIYLGRDPNVCEVPIQDKKISRKHAKIIAKNDSFIIEDLNSTNGVFVDGKKIDEASLIPGISFRLGKIKIQFDTKDKKYVSNYKELSKAREQSSQASVLSKTIITSQRIDLASVKMKDILLEINKLKRTGKIGFTMDEKQGLMYTQEGEIIFVNFDNVYNEKALARALLIDHGVLNFESISLPQLDIIISENTNDLLEKLERENNILIELKNNFTLPLKLKLASKLKGQLSLLKEDVLDCLQLVINFSDLRLILDKSNLSDLQTYEIILFLLDKGYVIEA
jgi:hypothetical protein